MTTIACSSNCIHQADGRCTLEQMTLNIVAVDQGCVYFEAKPKKQGKEAQPVPAH